MHKKRIIIGYILGFVASVLLSLLVILLVYKFTIGNKEYIINLLEKDNYFEKINDEINEEMGLYILSSGFTDEIYKNTYAKEDVTKDIKLFIDNAYDGKITTIDKSDILTKINANIDEFFKNNNLLTVNKTELVGFINGLGNVYSDEITLYQFTDNIISKIPKIDRIVNIMIIIISISLIILCFIFYKIRYCYSSATIIASGLILLFIRLFIFENIDIEDLLVITEKFSFELRHILSILQNISLILGVCLIIIGLIIGIVKSCVKYKKQSIKYLQ